MTRSDARMLNIDINSLTNDTPSKKRKMKNDDRKEATKRMKLDQKSEEKITLSCNQLISNNGNAEKKRQLYKNILGFNGNGQNSRKQRASKSFLAAPKVDEVSNTAQLDCLPPKNVLDKTELKVQSTLGSIELNSSNGEVENKRNVSENVLEFEKDSHEELKPSAPITEPIRSPQNNVVAKIDFRINEIIWCKIRGYPAWPCKIKTFVKNMAIVVWFNDYRTTKVYKTQLQKFLINFDTHAQNFDDNIGLKTAAQEALLYYGNALSN